jgi:hypothetical protein
MRRKERSDPPEVVAFGRVELGQPAVEPVLPVAARGVRAPGPVEQDGGIADGQAEADVHDAASGRAQANYLPPSGTRVMRGVRCSRSAASISGST